MTIFAVDTCSLIALQYSGHLEAIFKNMDIIITKKIHCELEEMKKFSDDDGVAAERILGSIPRMKVVETRSKPTGEEELIELALHKKCDFIVSDDLRALSKLNKTGTPVIFSTHILYYLYRKGIISKDDSMIALEMMRNRRSWKENFIYITGKQLFEQT
ncbi:MAG: hypothetical protein Q7J35_16525 [Candidatus Methanoperedens sp.]|nr:hypothetical protein [Candidatus Methanoperedens sp.]